MGPRDIRSFGHAALLCRDMAAPGAAQVPLAFRVPTAAIGACHAEPVAKGVPILRPPADLPAWRHRTLFLRDPEGNLIEIDARSERREAVV